MVVSEQEEASVQARKGRERAREGCHGKDGLHEGWREGERGEGAE